MTLREKVKWLYKAGHDQRFLRLLLRQETICIDDKDYVEFMFRLCGVENEELPK